MRLDRPYRNLITKIKNFPLITGSFIFALDQSFLSC